MPPIAGLQLIWPSVSMLCVSSSVRAAHPGRGQRRFGAGMTAADDDDIEMIGKTHDEPAEAPEKGGYCRPNASALAQQVAQE